MSSKSLHGRSDACADAHVTTVVACTFLEATSSTERSMALSSDSRGRLVFHNVTGYLSITNFLAGQANSPSKALLVLVTWHADMVGMVDMVEADKALLVHLFHRRRVPLNLCSWRHTEQ